MFVYSILCCIVAIVAALFGFTGFAVGAGWVAASLFVLFQSTRSSFYGPAVSAATVNNSARTIPSLKAIQRNIK
jgi:uncharacterized membrane protein YtjA (UPF0391 family)